MMGMIRMRWIRMAMQGDQGGNNGNAGNQCGNAGNRGEKCAESGWKCEL